MNVTKGAPAPFDDRLAAAGLIVADFDEVLLGYENADELAADPGWVAVYNFSDAMGHPSQYIRGTNPTVEAREIRETRLVWRWA